MDFIDKRKAINRIWLELTLWSKINNEVTIRILIKQNIWN